MSNEILSKAVKAVVARCEAKGWEVVEREWRIPTGASAIVMRDEDALAFVNVTVSSDGFDESASLTRGEYEMLAMTWLESHDVDGDVAVRFDEAAFHVASDGNRALMRYHFNVMGR